MVKQRAIGSFMILLVCLGVAVFAGEAPAAPEMYDRLVVAAAPHTRLTDLLRNAPTAPAESGVFCVSPDGGHVAFIDFADGKACVNVDGRPGAWYDAIFAGTLTFSANGRHIAYAAKLNGKAFVVLDGAPRKEYDAILQGTLAFSPDGARLMYGAKTGDQVFVVVDGREQQAYDGILKGTMVFGQDGQQLAYAVKSGEHYFMVVNGREEALYRGILESTVAFSPDCRRMAYAVKNGDKVRVIVDAKEGKEYDAILKDTPIFSPDGKHVAYGGKVGAKTTVVVDGKESPLYDAVIRGLVFSPNSKRLAYIAVNQSRGCVVVDGSQGPPYDAVFEGSMAFSPDSSRFAYVAKAGGRAFAVIDAKEQKKYDAIGAEGIVFSPDGKRSAYTAKIGDQWCAVVDGLEQGLYDAVTGLTFSPDGAGIAYAARQAQKELAVVNGREGAGYDKILICGGKGVVYDTPAHYHFLALKADGLYQVSSYPQALRGNELEQAISTMRNVRFDDQDKMGTWAKLNAVEAARNIVRAEGVAGYVRLRREIEEVGRTRTKDDFFLLSATALLWELGDLSEAGAIAAVWRATPLTEQFEYVFHTAFAAAQTQDLRALPLLEACLRESQGQFYVGEHDLKLQWPLTQRFLWGTFGPLGLPYLTQVLARSGDPDELQSAALLLTDAMYLPALPLIRKCATDGPPDVRGMALICLGRFGHPGDYALLTVNLSDDVPEELRKFYVYALGLYGDFRAIPLVTPLLRAKHDELRLSAVSCLMRLTTPATLASLEEYAGETKNDEQERALCASHVQRVMEALGLTWHDFALKPEEEKQRLVKLYRDWEYELQPGERALTHDEFLDAMTAWEKSRSMSGSLCAWVEPRHVLPVAAADDLERLLKINATFYSRLSDECLNDVAKISLIVERVGRSRYRTEPGLTAEVTAK